VFFHARLDEHGRPVAAPNHAYQHAWAKACRDAGHPGRRVHDLRRYAARNLVRAGVSETVALALLGHRTPSVCRRYNVTDERDLGAAVERLAEAAVERLAEAAAERPKRDEARRA
jgi:integrase